LGTIPKKQEKKEHTHNVYHNSTSWNIPMRDVIHMVHKAEGIKVPQY